MAELSAPDGAALFDPGLGRPCAHDVDSSMSMDSNVASWARLRVTRCARPSPEARRAWPPATCRHLILMIALPRRPWWGCGPYFLKVQHAHPLQFMGTLWLTAVGFSPVAIAYCDVRESCALGALPGPADFGRRGIPAGDPAVLLPRRFRRSCRMPRRIRRCASIAGCSVSSMDAMWFLASFHPVRCARYAAPAAAK